MLATGQQRLRPCSRRGQAKPRRLHQRQFALGGPASALRASARSRRSASREGGGPQRQWKKASRRSSPMRTVIKNGTIVTAVDQYNGDLVIEDEKIALIGTRMEMAADRVSDASGCYVLPGGIDVHTHLDMPFGGTNSIDDFESGTIAAAHGGTTTLVDFAIQKKGGSMKEALDTWHARAEGKAAIDYGFHMIAT